jgi:hypothetical protein
MPKFYIKPKDRHIVVRVQEFSSKILPDGRKGWRGGHAKSLSIYGDVTVEEIFEIVRDAIEKASKEEVELVKSGSKKEQMLTDNQL